MLLPSHPVSCCTLRRVLFLGRALVCSATQPAPNLILTLGRGNSVLSSRREARCFGVFLGAGRGQNRGQSAPRLLTFFLWAPLISFESRAGCSPFWGSPPGLMAGSDHAQKCLLMLASYVLPACCMAATTVTLRVA